MRACIACVLSLLITGCAAHYATPGRGAQMEMFGGATPQEQALNTDAGIAKMLEKKPLAAFPASVAVVRVQAPGYKSHTAAGLGDGSYSVVTTRDVEADTDVAKFSRMPMLRGVAMLNRLVIPPRLQSDFELRQAAAKLHADILLVYTIDTQFLETSRTTPITLLTLGATTTKNMRVLCTASAALLDTRSGYVYGLAEGSSRHEELQNAWKTEDEVDQVRRRLESKAFTELVGELQQTWGGVIQEHATARANGVRYRTQQGN